MLRRKAGPRPLIVTPWPKSVIGSVCDPVLIRDQKRAALFTVSRGQVANARREIDRKIRQLVQPRRQGIQVFLIASEVTADHTQLGKTRGHTVARIENAFLRWRVRRSEERRV